MSDVDPNDPRLQGRPLWGLAILALPVVGVPLVLLAYVVMVSLGLSGRAATEVWSLDFVGCPASEAIVAARAADMGLRADFRPTESGFRGTLSVPDDEAVARSVPATLTKSGAFEIRAADAVLATNAEVLDASVRLDLMMMPSTLVKLAPDAADQVVRYVRKNPEGQLDFVLDGVRVGGQSAQNPVAIGEVEIAPATLDEQERMRVAAELSVLIDNGPLPCTVTWRRE